jgi:hypothetical protein
MRRSRSHEIVVKPIGRNKLRHALIPIAKFPNPAPNRIQRVIVSVIDVEEQQIV